MVQSAPVISVGNLAMGGRGKTPVVRLITRWLVEAGERPSILSRGYGRRTAEPGVVIVSDGSHVLADLDRSGDEPLMLARALPGAAVLVCDVRATAAALAERALGCTVHVLDDGFQHPIRRDVDIVLVAPDDLTARRLPFGRLREPVTALARAAAVVIDDGGASDEARAATVRGIASVAPQARVFRLVRTLGQVLDFDASLDSAPRTPDFDRGKPVIALAGIANPERFARALVDAGWIVADLVAFPDHHRYRARDIRRIADAARATNASAILTTEKDGVRLRPLRPLRTPVPVSIVPLDVRMEPDLQPWLAERLAAVRERARA